MASEASLQTSFQGAINCCPLHLPPLSFLVPWCGQTHLARSVSSGWSKLIMVFLGADKFSNQVWAHHMCVVQKVVQEAIQTLQSLGHSFCPHHKIESMCGLGVGGDVRVDFSTESIYLETVRKPVWGWNQDREKLSLQKCRGRTWVLTHLLDFSSTVWAINPRVVPMVGGLILFYFSKTYWSVHTSSSFTLVPEIPTLHSRSCVGHHIATKF